ncbi:hypothetical protein MLD52_18225 [Puniceicoccaceae bacterium K14]|nr:hypothetical protein [Puniceicoccaceae bacterium K14]
MKKIPAAWLLLFLIAVFALIRFIDADSIPIRLDATGSERTYRRIDTVDPQKEQLLENKKRLLASLQRQYDHLTVVIAEVELAKEEKLKSALRESIQKFPDNAEFKIAYDRVVIGNTIYVCGFQTIPSISRIDEDILILETRIDELKSIWESNHQVEQTEASSAAH